jgi:predicted metal-dependent peptidase
MTTTTLTPEQDMHFMAWRATALETMPYMASLLFAFRPVASTGVDTFGVDDYLRLYINFENTIGKGPQFNSEALLHEASHILGDHSALALVAGVTDDERDLFNYAGDCAINDDLRDAGCSLLAAHGVFGAQIGEPDYQTPLHYMEALRKRRQAAQKKKQNQQGQGQPSGQPGQGNPGQGQPQQGNGQGQPQPGQGQPQQGQGNGQGQSVPMKGCGSGAGGRKGGHELDPDATMGGKAEAATDAEKAMIRIETAAAVRQHQEQHGIGSVPGGIAQIIDEILTPSTTPWQKMLASFVRRCVASKAGNHDMSYRRRNRRQLNTELADGKGRIVGRVVAPGYIKPVPSVRFYRDTSGSVSDHDLAVATNEVKGIAQKLGIRGEDLIISDVDVVVHQSVEYTGVASVSEVQGRGGTDMCRAIEHACSQRKKPSVIIVATDGETGWPEVRPSVPVVVLLVNVRSQHWIDNVPEWAHLVEVKTDV